MSATAWVNPNSGKAHQMGTWWQADDGTVTPSGTTCGALLRGYRQQPLSEVERGARCKVCWPTTTRTTTDLRDDEGGVR